MATKGCSIVIVIILVSLHFNRTYDLKCPENQHFIHRASKCQNPKKYLCLINPLNDKYWETCTGPDRNPPGTKVVFQPYLHKANCTKSRYQPIIFETWMNSDCILQKSKCKEEGQVVYFTGSTVTDVQCTCDYTKGYTFVSPPVNKCFCVPSEEDCSCYIPGCKVSQDHTCEDDTTSTASTKPVCKTIDQHLSIVDKDNTSIVREAEENTKLSNGCSKVLAGTCTFTVVLVVCLSMIIFCILLLAFYQFMKGFNEKAPMQAANREKVVSTLTQTTESIHSDILVMFLEQNIESSAFITNLNKIISKCNFVNQVTVSTLYNTDQALEDIMKGCQYLFIFITGSFTSDELTSRGFRGEEIENALMGHSDYPYIITVLGSNVQNEVGYKLKVDYGNMKFVSQRHRDDNCRTLRELCPALK